MGNARAPAADAPGELDTCPGPVEAPSRQPTAACSPTEPAPKTTRRRNSYREGSLNLTVVTQNIRGVQGFIEPNGQSRDLGKLETLTRVLLDENIDVFLVQETWLTGDWIKSINGVTVIHHGPPAPTSRRGSGGVAILLGPKAKKAWQAAGRPDPHRPGPLGDSNTRFAGVTLLFRPKRNQTQRIFIGNVYAPHSGLAADDPNLLERFYLQLEDCLSSAVPSGTDIILGGDWNAQVGIRRDPTDQPFLGPFGIDRSSASGDFVLDLARHLNLRVSTSYFKAHTYATFYDQLHDRRPLQLDYFLTSQRFGNRVTDAKVYYPPGGIVSDHEAVRLRLRLSRPLKRNKANDPTKRGDKSDPNAPLNDANMYTDWSRLHGESAREEYQTMLDTVLHTFVPDPSRPTPSQLTEAIHYVAERALLVPHAPRRCTWFNVAEAALRPLRDAEREAYHRYRASESEATRRHYRSCRRKYLRIARQAKKRYFEAYAEELDRKAMSNNPRVTWMEIRRLSKGSYAHHYDANDAFALRDPVTGQVAISDKANASILQSYCTNLYNRTDAPFDPTVLDEIDQRPLEATLGAPPTFDELEDAIRKMKNNKAPGESGVPAEALKALSTSQREIVLQMVSAYWNGEPRHEEWDSALLKVLYKGKGDSKDLKNYRVIVLQDIFARLLSLLITARLNTLAKKTGMFNQFANVGTQDATYVLRTALQTRREHELDSYVLFVDLIKAFDTANHDLLFSLLAKYGAPPALVSAISRMHADFQLKFTLGKTEATVPYTVGVRQGDNMAPILFLFLMNAMSETLAKKRQREQRASGFSYRYHRPTSTSTRGRIRNQPRPQHTRGVSFNLLDILFVDDTALIAATYEELTIVAAELHAHFRRFGLLMHVGTLNADGTWEKSKTEAMFFPANVKASQADTLDPPPPAVFPDGRHRIEYTTVFRYLGSRLTPSLTDDTDVDTRIRLASNQMGAMTNFFRSCADLHTKRSIFLSIPVNTLLYGCESWALTAELEKKISTCYHKWIRRILGINMHDVEVHHIRNEHIRTKFSVPDILDELRYRQFHFLGKIARLPDEHLQRKFLGAWVGCPRKVGRPQTTLRHSQVNCLQAICGPSISSDGRLSDWIEMTRDYGAWCRLGRRWVTDQQSYNAQRYGNHPRLGRPVRVRSREQASSEC